MVLAWEPISDLPQDWSSLTDGELGPLLQFWKDQRADLEQSGALAEFNKRLGREWSIETGQIEGVYNLDRGLTETLIERGIDSDLIPNQPGQKPPEIIAAIIQDHADVLEGLFEFVKGDRPISKSYIHELHAALLRHQDTTAVRDQFGNLFEAKLVKGKYKERPNNPKKPDGSMHQYCPPEQVDSEMERLLLLHAEHEKKGVPVEIEAAWLHHRFTQIHPYQDGNGRVARALASLLFIKAGWFPVVVTREDRTAYIDALEVADESDLRSLVSFFTQLQKRALFEAMQTLSETVGASTVDEAIEAAKKALKTIGNKKDPAIWRKAKETAERLLARAAIRLSDISNALRTEVGTMSGGFQFDVLRHGFRSFHVSLPLAQSNPSEYRDGYALEIIRESPKALAFIEVQACAIGSKFRGLIGCQVVFNDRTGGESRVASGDHFLVNYTEPFQSAERRFRPWLEESLVNALTLWRKSL
jgi:Fic family protein